MIIMNSIIIININIITNLPCHSSLSQNDPFYRTQMCLKQSDCQNSRNNFANLLKLLSKLLEQLCKLVQNYQPGSSSLRMAISIVFFGPIFKLVLSISGSRLTCIIIVVVIHTYPDMYKVASKIISLRQFWAASIPLSVRHKHNSCLLFGPVGSSSHQRTR